MRLGALLLLFGTSKLTSESLVRNNFKTSCRPNTMGSFNSVVISAVPMRRKDTVQRSLSSELYVGRSHVIVTTINLTSKTYLLSSI